MMENIGKILSLGALFLILLIIWIKNGGLKPFIAIQKEIRAIMPDLDE